MHVTQIIPARRWRNTLHGRLASIYGAAPWAGDSDKQNWLLEQVGFTLAWSDDTVSHCAPLPDIDSAKAEANRINANQRQRLYAHAEAWPEQAEHCAAAAAEIPTF